MNFYIIIIIILIRVVYISIRCSTMFIFRYISMLYILFAAIQDKQHYLRLEGRHRKLDFLHKKTILFVAIQDKQHYLRSEGRHRKLDFLHKTTQYFCSTLLLKAQHKDGHEQMQGK